MADEHPFDPCASLEVAEYARGLAGDDLETRIHPADEMYRFELSAPRRTPDIAAIRYFAIGHSIARTVAELARWRFGALAGVRSFLDFASGRGRTTRFLVRTLEPERITVADIDSGAVRFQEETFGVRGIVSESEPARFPAKASSFDFVLAVSFFSHLPAGRFEAWLSRLWSCVAPGGLLAFSAHGERVRPASVPMPETGLAYVEASETARLPSEEYGTAWVTPEFVRRAAAGAAPDGRLSFHPDGLCGAQDLYVLVRPPLPPGAGPRLSRDPLGALEWAAVEGDIVTARGWAQGDSGERPPDVKLYVGAAIAASSPGTGPPGSRREWRFELPTDGIPPDRVIRIEAESERRASRLLVTETLGPYLPGAISPRNL